MPKIKLLPDTLISQIAAGEVVERPASVVKELLENSLDAGAKNCWIEVEQGGMKLIAVRDDGCGIPPEDARMVFARHATSKVATLDDLANIHSYGFRGEAVAAIASVSHVTMRTREPDSPDQKAGTEIVFKGGKLESEHSAGCPTGTEIIVRNLFFNTPARKKFLKKETTEFAHIMEAVSNSALANPETGFVLRHNGKIILDTAQGTAEARVAAILGKQFFQESLAVSFKTLSIVIHGCIGQPGMSRSSRKQQYLFVNGRPVSDSTVARAVLDAYGSRLPARSYPAYVLHIDIDPQEVDVNVHPRKLAVKFLDGSRVYRDVSQAVSQALEEFEGGASMSERFVGLQDKHSRPIDANSIQNALNFSEQFLNQEKSPDGIANPQQSPSQFRILGQIADSYILIFDEQGISIADQHAAHERIMYEKFKRNAEEKKQQSQPLLVPLTIECSQEEAVFLDQAIEFLTGLGFEFDRWSGNTFVVRACPVPLKSENLSAIFRDFLDDMVSGKEGNKIFPERILKSLACKAAVKFGMPLSPQEQEALLLELQRTPNNATCPHGRPTKIQMTFEELERKFYRRK